jgi:hypothetical protein
VSGGLRIGGEGLAAALQQADGVGQGLLGGVHLVLVAVEHPQGGDPRRHRPVHDAQQPELAMGGVTEVLVTARVPDPGEAGGEEVGRVGVHQC